jgi:hypothetical protein
MKYCAFTLGVLLLLGATAVDAAEVVSIWSKGAKVCIRTYQGWEAKILVNHPGDFPTLKANVNTAETHSFNLPQEFFDLNRISSAEYVGLTRKNALYDQIKNDLKQANCLNRKYIERRCAVEM